MLLCSKQSVTYLLPLQGASSSNWFYEVHLMVHVSLLPKTSLNHSALCLVSLLSLLARKVLDISDGRLILFPFIVS